MKKILIAITAMALFTVKALAADKPVDDNMVGLTTENGRIVYNFINEWWNEKKGEEAWNKYVSRENYLNHAVYSASTSKKPSFEEEMESEVKIANASSTVFEVKQLVSQGSLVFAHVHGVKQEGPGSELVMIFRVRDGRITDHWDIHEALKEDSMVFEELDR